MQNKKFIYGLFFILILFFLKAVYLYFLDLPLSYDEAYYWNWSRFLDFGYYNKPPMIAWIIRAGTEILGNTEFAVRFPALIFITLTLLFSYLLIYKYKYNEFNALLLLLTFSFIPILTAYSFIMTIDPPLIFFWILSLFFFIKYLENPDYKNALFTGIFIGLGLLTKQTMFSFLFLSAIYLLIFKNTLFFKKETFFLFLISLLIYFPNFYWNYTHQFFLIKHTEEHFSRKTLSIYSFLKFLRDSIGVYTPLFLFFIYIGNIYAKKFFKKEFPESLNFLYFLSFPVILGFIFLSFFIKLNVNWILPFSLTGFLFFFAYLSFSKKWKVLVFSNLILSVILSFTVYLFGYFPDKFPEPFQVLLEKFKGWEILAERVGKYYNGDFALVTERRDIAAVLSFYVKRHPEIYVIQFGKYPENQYHLWRNTNTLIGKEVLAIKKGFSAPFYLENLEKVEEITIKITKKRYKYFSLWKGVFKPLK
uniref:Glycosyltransferase family 39 protein n=1 Tax=Thermodesulfobacterium geofontis TaxID=1295609 RepID=A0A7V4N4K0_9BACT